jgi:hypothetical protein
MQRARAFFRSLIGLKQESVVRPAGIEADTFSNEVAVPGKRTVITGPYKVELDLTSQVLAVKAPIDRDFDFYYKEDYKPGPAEARLKATLDWTDKNGFLSASVLAQKAKIFDDGLYAAVEVAAQNGTGQHAGKASLLSSLSRALAETDPLVAQTAQELVLGATILGHVPVEAIPPGVEPHVRHAVEVFLANELRSKPLGFYTWSEQLRNIFQQDRMLQGEIDATGIKAIANALRVDPVARGTYESHLRFVSRLTNPFANPDFRKVLDAIDRGSEDIDAKGIRFFPPSVAHETNLGKKLYGDKPIPDDFVLVDEMIRQIRSGELKLDPGDDSGWYDYQTWSMEPLVIPERMPEGKCLRLDDEYRKLLLELFKGMLTLTRETHVKQLEMVELGAAMGPEEEEVFIDIDPALSAEPLATHYLRRAVGYRFVRSVLEEAVGTQALQSLHRLTANGPVATSLAAELSTIEALFFGAHVKISQELGLAPDTRGSSMTASDAADRFASWVRDLGSDPDLSLDLRAMVPIFYDVERRKTKVWAFLGWTDRPIKISFAQPPTATVRNLDGTRPSIVPEIRWGFLYEQLQYPVTAELYVDKVLDRDEFRKLCDSCVTRSEIVRRLNPSEGPA